MLLVKYLCYTHAEVGCLYRGMPILECMVIFQMVYTLLWSIHFLWSISLFEPQDIQIYVVRFECMSYYH